MAVPSQVFELIESTVEGLGYELVDVERLPRGLIRVTIDKEGGITLDDCEKVSNLLNPALTVDNVDFDRLEVSSPGVDRPLRRANDFVRFVGSNVHIELYTPMTGEGLPANGRRRMDGKLLAVEGDEANPTITLELITERLGRTPSEIAKAKAKAKKSGEAQAAPVILNIPFKDIERASLLTDLDFRGSK